MADKRGRSRSSQSLASPPLERAHSHVEKEGILSPMNGSASPSAHFSPKGGAAGDVSASPKERRKHRDREASSPRRQRSSGKAVSNSNDEKSPNGSRNVNNSTSDGERPSSPSLAQQQQQQPQQPQQPQQQMDSNSETSGGAPLVNDLRISSSSSSSSLLQRTPSSSNVLSPSAANLSASAVSFAAGGGSSGSVASSLRAKDKLALDVERLRRAEEELTAEAARLKRAKSDLKRGQRVTGDSAPGAAGNEDSLSSDSTEASADTNADSVTEEQLAQLSDRERKKVLRRLAKQQLGENKQAKEELRRKQKQFKEQKKEVLKTAKHEVKREKQALARMTDDQALDMKCGWAKMRGSPIRNWYERWFVLRPGQLLYYASEYEKNPSGIIDLTGCVCKERKSKMKGLCFKIEHPDGKPIYLSRGIKGGTLASGLVPAGADHCILRVRDKAAGADWIREISNAIKIGQDSAAMAEFQRLHMLEAENEPAGESATQSPPLGPRDEEEREDASESYSDGDDSRNARSSSADPVVEPELVDFAAGESNDVKIPGLRELIERLRPERDDGPDQATDLTQKVSVLVLKEETRWVEDRSDRLTIFDTGETHIAGDNKSFMLMLLKQVRIGMDLSKVVLPSFILEPRSVLEKLTDFMTHCDLLARVKTIEDPLSRMLQVVRFYLSGMYIKPKGVKKPYNPIVGEWFRCMWPIYEGGGDGSNGARMQSATYYVAEQVSHHPPISCFYTSNRAAGFAATGTVVFRSKFYGTSAAVILDGFATLYFPSLDESYEITFPTLYAKGFITGPLTTEFNSKVSISCVQTGYRTDIEFKGKSLFGGEPNLVEARVRDAHNHSLFRVKGKWDEKLTIAEHGDVKKYRKSYPDMLSSAAEDWIRETHRECVQIAGASDPAPVDLTDEHVLWWPNEAVYDSRPRKHKPRELHKWESDRLWQECSRGLDADDQTLATEAKQELEGNQRSAEKLRRDAGIEYTPRLFEKDPTTGVWIYKYAKLTPWDDRELLEVDELGLVQSRGPLLSAKGILRTDLQVAPISERAMEEHRRLFRADASPNPAAINPEEEVIAHKRNIPVPEDLKLYPSVPHSPARTQTSDRQIQRVSSNTDTSAAQGGRTRREKRTVLPQERDPALLARSTKEVRAFPRRHDDEGSATFPLRPDEFAERLARLEEHMLALAATRATSCTGDSPVLEAAKKRALTSALFSPVYILLFAVIVFAVRLQLRLWALERLGSQ